MVARGGREGGEEEEEEEKKIKEKTHDNKEKKTSIFLRNIEIHKEQKDDK